MRPFLPSSLGPQHGIPSLKRKQTFVIFSGFYAVAAAATSPRSDGFSRGIAPVLSNPFTQPVPVPVGIFHEFIPLKSGSLSLGAWVERGSR